ncbi:cytochrome P450 [Coprinellus micaceus]|uniref:Cytochrome P450 n=1 Tax=Coprinellus micaceus TaxID=71717 RepID=A0A4Y7TEP5_COPMI|nr:cytochrome P450 [Coprinellus micaceus]
MLDSLPPIRVVDGLAACGLVYVISKLLAKRPVAPLPPGPKRLPLLGNLLDMPTQQEWLTFAEWGKKYGDIASISLFGQEFFIVSSAQVAIEMLEKKSAIYSDRPVMEMGGELVGWKHTLVLLPYGDRFRSYRKMFHQVIGTNAAMANFHPVEEAETHRFLKLLLERPKEFANHIRVMAGGIILRISHGYTIQEKNDPFVTLADEATEQFSMSTAPGGFLVNLVPPLKHIPGWFPGAGFQKIAKEWRVTLHNMVEGPHRFVKDQMAAGTAEPSFTSNLLESKDLTAEEEFNIKWSAASLYSGGSDTTVSTLHAFFLAMSLFPEVQKKAQAELDSVIGNGRLPSMDDRSQLPYCNAVASEALRWHCVTPTAVPHRVMEDNIFNGYFIPKGSLIMPNIWFMLHDPRVYPNPSEFIPERFLGPNPQPDPRQACFGFGRRICPGRVLADTSVFLGVASILAVFDISKAKDDNGNIIEPPLGQTNGTISHPNPFPCEIKPRSQAAVELISAPARQL